MFVLMCMMLLSLGVMSALSAPLRRLHQAPAHLPARRAALDGTATPQSAPFAPIHAPMPRLTI